MAKKLANSVLQASTIDILNVIRANASAEYQDLVPEVTKASEVSKVGDVFMGYPAMANQFLSALINRIALVRVKSATFNNPYSRLKKGYLEFGETVEEIFVGIANVREFSVEKAPEREFKRSLPDVRSAFHIMNWRVQYPVTVQDQDLYQAFTSMDGVQNLIATIVQQVYTAAEYDEFLLFKYLIIKSVAKGTFKPLSIGDGSDMTVAAKQFRATSNQLTFMSKDYNAAGVLNNTPRERQVIFMDSQYNAAYDVEVLAAAFNMDKATFMGSLYLIDDFTSFDNDRFSIIKENSDMIEDITDAELALMKDVKAVMIDEDWFQVYDNNAKFTEKYVASGMYWNYFYNVWKTVSTSPYANAVAFATDSAIGDLPETYVMAVSDKSESAGAVVLSINTNLDKEKQMLAGSNFSFVQTQEATEAGIAIHKYGAIIIPASAVATAIKLEIDVNGTIYQSETSISATTNVGDEVKFVKKS
jgi:hypothetical protein